MKKDLKKGLFLLVLFSLSLVDLVANTSKVEKLNTSATKGTPTEQTELLNEAEKGNHEKIEHLLKQGANVNQTNKHGETALMVAIRNGFDEVVEVLLKYKADLTIKNKKGETALQLATAKKHQDMVDMLKANGAK